MIQLRTCIDSEIYLRRLATEVICDIMADNSEFIYDTGKKKLPYLKQLLENKAQELEVIKKSFEWTERRFAILWAKFDRYKNFIDKNMSDKQRIN